jgi:hypothetical protein
MSEPTGKYASYLLRLWQADGAGKPVYRASLESAQSGEGVGFANLAELFGFLWMMGARDAGRGAIQGQASGPVRAGCPPESRSKEQS